ncbi:MAG: DUF3095 domain-containing protein [Marinibacterium sp.]
MAGAGGPSETFYNSLPPVTGFDALCRADGYAPLPGDWWVGVADIAQSTQAIAQGAYKAVNMVGSAVISAQINAHGDRSFPFVFGGDGAAFAVPPVCADDARAALRAVMAWSNDAYGLTLRGALIPVARIRAAGSDVRVTRFAASAEVDYAMFAGGGVAWAEAELKAGRIGTDPAPPGTEPDLTGLSCRWANMKARNGTILSVIVLPGPKSDDAGFAAFCAGLLEMTRGLARGGHPVPDAGPAVKWPGKGIALELAAPGRRLIPIVLENLAFWASLWTRWRPGGFDGRAYAREVAQNADFRKFDDGLKMTLDCDAATLGRLKAHLAEAETAGRIVYGTTEQDEAMMTCVVPSFLAHDHIHFVDGAAGGYAGAAARIKAAR